MEFSIKPFIPRIISLIVALIGLFILINSTDTGLKYAQDILSARDGMNTGEYRLLQAEYIETLRWLGSIILGIGLFQCLRKFDSGELIQLKIVKDSKNNDL